MSSASRVLSDRARAIIEAAEASARPGTSRAGRLPEGLPVTPPRRRPTAQPLLRAVEPATRRAAPPAPAAPAVDPAAVAAIPDPERLLALIQKIALQAGEVRRRLDALSEAVGRVEADVRATGTAAAPVAPAVPVAPQAVLPDEPVIEVPFEPVAAEPAPSAVSRPLVAPATPPVPEPVAAPAAREPSPPSETARLVAIEMAVGGASRAEARTRLTDEFGIRDVDGLLDDVFGPGSDGNSRMRWA